MKKFSILLFLFIFKWSLFSQNLKWIQHIGNNNVSSKGLSITSDLKGNVYTTGSFGNSPDFDYSSNSYTLTSNGQIDVFVTKHDSSGNLIWARGLGGASKDEGNSIKIDASGNLLITGVYTGIVDFDPSPLSSYILNGQTLYENLFILKLDNDGNFVWAKKIDENNSFSAGRSITTDTSNNVFITGYFSNTSDFDPGINADTLKNFGNWDAFILKLDSMGNYIWAKNIGTSPSNTEGNYIALDGNQNIYVTGFFEGSSDFNPSPASSILNPSGSSDIYILKLDYDGNFVWAKKLGGVGPDKGTSLVIDNMKNVYTTGYFESTADFDPDVITTYTLNASYGLNTFISKLDSSGNFIWAKNIGRNLSNNIATSIAKDHLNNLYITGCYMNTTDFDPGIDSFYVYMQSINTNNVAYILKLDSLGNFKNVITFGSGSYGAFGQGITLDNSGNIFTTGKFSGTGDFDPGVAIQYLSSLGLEDIYIGKFSKEQYVDINEYSNNIFLKIFPNPNNGAFTITSKEKINLTITNNLGQTIQSLEINENTNFQQNITINTSGIYYISGITDKKIIKQKIIVTK